MYQARAWKNKIGKEYVKTKNISKLEKNVRLLYHFTRFWQGYMSISKNLIIKICGDEYKIYERRVKKENIIEDYEVTKINKKNIYILIEGEGILSKKFIFDNRLKSNLHKSIDLELKYELNSKENIIYTYKVLPKYKEDKKKICVLVNCINNKYIENLKTIYKNKNKIKSIEVIQFIVLRELKRKVKNLKTRANYPCIFYLNGYSYYMEIQSGIIIKNLIKKCNIAEFVQYLNEIQIKERKMYNILINNKKQRYKNIIKDIKVLRNYNADVLKLEEV